HGALRRALPLDEPLHAGAELRPEIAPEKLPPTPRRSFEQVRRFVDHGRHPPRAMARCIDRSGGVPMVQRRAHSVKLSPRGNAERAPPYPTFLALRLRIPREVMALLDTFASVRLVWLQSNSPENRALPTD